MKQWYEVYKLIGDGLSDFFLANNKNKNVGELLYKKLIADSDFLANNKWADAFSKDFGETSIDPLHIYSSISINSVMFEQRLRRINILLRTFGHKEIRFLSELENFKNWPDQKVIKQLNSREKEYQFAYWNLFFDTFSSEKKRLQSINKYIFNSLSNYDLNQITSFLFWINSELYLPLYPKIEKYLRQNSFLEARIYKYEEYLSLLKDLDQQRRSFNEIVAIAHGRTIIKETTVFPEKGIELTKEHELNGKEESKYTKRKEEVYNDLGFRLIAIRALDDCNQEHLNNLEKGRYYYFEQAFQINEDNIEYDIKKVVNIFVNNDCKINVTAIVGKNGSGKSSLIELLYRIINNIAYKYNDVLSKVDLIHVKDLHAELYFLMSGDIFKVVLDNTKIDIHSYSLSGNRFEINKKEDSSFKAIHFYDFFYTISVNYSHYSLNSLHLGNWIQKLFHKNDSYQTPLVINPMRTKGNIDINIENGLLYSRLISNLLAHKSEDLRGEFTKLTEKQWATRINYKLKINKEEVVFKENNDTNKIFFSDIILKDKVISIIVNYIGIQDRDRDSEIIWNESKIYFIKKLIRIGLTYTKYNDFIDPNSKQFYENYEEFIKLILDDTSHISYKFKQLINYWKYPNLWAKADFFKIIIKEDSIRLNNFKSIKEKDNIIEFIPPSIFAQEIILEDEVREVSTFEKLSSGEKQLIHSVNSIIYHIRNLDSIVPNIGLITYENINIILDEIELYYHPELQRRFINTLIHFLSSLELNRDISINMCLITHSPYILSDIPTPNILFLKSIDGKSIPQKVNLNTFGANIHELLTDSFFMEEGYMGVFAKEKINNVIGYLEKIISKTPDSHNFNWDKESVKNLIDLIGEPLIRNSLLDLYNKAFFNSYEQIENEIARLHKIRNQLSK